MPPKGHKGTSLSQVVSDSGNEHSDEEISVRSTLEKLEIQLQKQEGLNIHLSNQIQANNERLQSSIQEFQSSFQLIFQELKELQKSKNSSNQSANEVNNAASILGQNPTEGNRSNHSPVINNVRPEFDRVTYQQMHKSTPFLHQKSMRLEFPAYNGSESSTEMVMEPEKVLARRPARTPQGTITEVLVKWKQRPVEDASWEDYWKLVARFPTFDLETRSIFDGRGSCYTPAIDTSHRNQ